MPEKFVTVAVCENGFEANVIRNHLENEGIRAYVINEAIGAMAWQLSNAIGGVKVQVAESDVESAQAILSSAEDSGEQDEEGDSGFQIVPGRSLADQLGATGEYHDDSEDDDPPIDPVDAKTTDSVERIYKAAILSVVLPPLILYSAFLFLALVFESPKLTVKQKRQLGIAAAINVVWLLLALVPLWARLSGW